MRLRKKNEGLDVKLKSNKKSIFDTLPKEDEKKEDKEVKQTNKGTVDGKSSLENVKKRKGKKEKAGKKTPNFTSKEGDSFRVKRKESTEKVAEASLVLDKDNYDVTKKNIKSKKDSSTLKKEDSEFHKRYKKVKNNSTATKDHSLEVKEKIKKDSSDLHEDDSKAKKRSKKVKNGSSAIKDHTDLKKKGEEKLVIMDEMSKNETKAKIKRDVRKVKSKADRNNLVKGASIAKKEVEPENVKKVKRSKDKTGKKEASKIEEYKLSSLEKEMLQKGTIKDKINILTLMVETNPSAENYKNLLFYTENQRNDVIFYTLNNVKDLLISKGPMKDYTVKQRITKTFEINLKNNFIKMKILRLVYLLLKNNIYFLELIYPFVNKIGDKKDLENYVADKCKSLFYVNEEVLLDCFEEFYFKNSNFKSRNSILKILSEVASNDPSHIISGELYNKFLDSFNKDLPEEHRNILLGYILEGLSRGLDLNPNLKINNVDLIKSCFYSDKISLYSFKLLFRTKSPYVKDLLYKIISNNIIRDSKHIQTFINYMYEYITETKDQNIIKYVVNTSLLYRKNFIISVLTMLYKYRNKNKLDLSNCYGLRLLTVHYSNVVRKMSTSILNKKKIDEVNPFDLIELEINENSN